MLSSRSSGRQLYSISQVVHGWHWLKEIQQEREIKKLTLKFFSSSFACMALRANFTSFQSARWIPQNVLYEFISCLYPHVKHIEWVYKVKEYVQWRSSIKIQFRCCSVYRVGWSPVQAIFDLKLHFASPALSRRGNHSFCVLLYFVVMWWVAGYMCRCWT